MKRDKWIWMPHPAHFICAFDCRFHLSTYVGGFIVSTIGEYFPDAPVREIIADSRGIVLKGMGDARKRDYMNRVGFDDLGCERKYETMVFEAVETISGGSCCPWRIDGGHELDMEGYNDPNDALKGHMKLCAKWSKKRVSA